MEIVLDAAHENGWHREWMSRTPFSYEWWYLDIISDDRQWALVTIFLLGNPFSSYYHQCRIGKSSNPLDSNAVLFALHKRGTLHHYLFASYPKAAIQIADQIDLDAQFGTNRFQSNPIDGQVVTLAATNANFRTLKALIKLNSSVEQPTFSRQNNALERHWWLPAAPVGQASVEIQISSLGISNEIEKISFNGSGYHDHNWGTLPFDSSILNWTWARTDFGMANAAVVYWITGKDGLSKTVLLVYRAGVLCVQDHSAEVSNVHYSLTKFGSRFPSSYVVRSLGITVSIRAAVRLEDVSFYVRYRVDATLDVDGALTKGVGVGEYISPAIMGTAAAGWAMSRRIYDPTIGS